MSWYELDALMDNIYLVDRGDWERTRSLGYIIAQCNSKRKLSPSKILHFPWDDEKSDSDQEKLSEEEKQKRDQEWKLMEESVRNMVRK